MTKFLAIFSLVIIVLLAFAACGEESTPTPAPAAQAIEAEVQRSVAAALADQSADSIREDAMSTEDMSALVQEAIGAQAPEGISPEQVQSAIERAVSEALDQATMASERASDDDGGTGSSDPRFHPAPPATAAPRVTAIPTPAPTATPAYRAPSTPAPTPGSNLLVAGPPVPTATAVPASRSTGTPTPPPSPAAVGTPSATTFKPESTEGRPWGQPLKKPAGAPLNLG